uniref:Uncharacterized protein n=1 Tax=Tanacetum cinerariifolium TaxID=118510 RepID=A0A6L2L8J4_TANCI|nr:hypothetical protein [Tanacetum cinerariifolium]
MSARPVWRKKLNYCNTSNVVDVNLPTPMLKPQSPFNEPSQENSPTTQSNQNSLQPHSLPLDDSCVTRVGQDLILPQRLQHEVLQLPSRAPNHCSSSVGKTRGVVIVHSRNRLGRLDQGINAAGLSITAAGSRLMLVGKADTAAEVTEEITLSS